MSTNVLKLGFWSALLTALITLGTFIIAVLTPPFSGPYCVTSCFQYPFLDIASRFPRDYFWMYPAMIQVFVYFLLFVSLHYFASKEKKIFSHIGVSLALLTMATFLTDYFLQVSIVQPSLLNREADGVSLLSQFNPHGIFIVLEELGYLLMSTSFLFMAFILSKKTKIEKAIYWVFIISFISTYVALFAYSYFYGVFREYRFEVAAISINWITLIISGILLSILFKRSLNNRN